MAALYSLYLGRQFHHNVSNALASYDPSFRPRVCLIIPSKGGEPGLERNIETALQQNYDNYYTVIVTDSREDPAYTIAKSVIGSHPKAASLIYVSEPSEGASGKVAALLTVMKREWGKAEVFAFLDSDSLVPSRWLRDLIQPLSKQIVGATTGFRWYFPSHGGFWPLVQSAWNAAGTNLLFNPRYNFPWGGAMAARAETLERINIRQRWETAISDDLTLRDALRENGPQIAFLPQCTVATYTESGRSEFLRWATRQTTLTRFYNPRLWRYAFAAYGFFDVVFLLGSVSLATSLILGPRWLGPSALLFTPSILGILRSLQRNLTFNRALPEFGKEFRKTRLGEAIVSLIVPWVMTYCIIKSTQTHEIEWRGRNYKLAR